MQCWRRPLLWLCARHRMVEKGEKEDETKEGWRKGKEERRLIKSCLARLLRRRWVGGIEKKRGRSKACLLADWDEGRVEEKETREEDWKLSCSLTKTKVGWRKRKEERKIKSLLARSLSGSDVESQIISFKTAKSVWGKMLQEPIWIDDAWKSFIIHAWGRGIETSFNGQTARPIAHSLAFEVVVKLGCIMFSYQNHNNAMSSRIRDFFSNFGSILQETFDRLRRRKSFTWRKSLISPKDGV